MVLVVGMARSGLAVTRLLCEQGLSVFATDSGRTELEPEFTRLGVPFEIGRQDQNKFMKADEIVVSPGVPLVSEQLLAAKDKGVPIVSELEVASRYLKGDIVAITGSNGKTTTTKLIGEILEQSGRPTQVGGNIGVAASDLVESSTNDTVNVLEVSSFQLDTVVKFHSDVSVLLNITPDHLDRYGDFNEYRNAKFKLFENQTESDMAIINGDDPACYPVPDWFRPTPLLFSRKNWLDSGASVSGEDLFVVGQRVLSVREIPLRGSHNVENVLAACLVGSIYGIAPEVMASTIRSFVGVEHRLESVATIGGIEFVNDSKATNVDSAIKSLQSFDANVIAIVGGTDKGASYELLVDAMKERVKRVILIGASSDKLASAIGDRSLISHANSMMEAVSEAYKVGRSGDTVLLAPACSSFDMFANFEERGEAFKAAVLAQTRVSNEK